MSQQASALDTQLPCWHAALLYFMSEKGIYMILQAIARQCLAAHCTLCCSSCSLQQDPGALPCLIPNALVVLSSAVVIFFKPTGGAPILRKGPRVKVSSTCAVHSHSAIAALSRQ